MQAVGEGLLDMEIYTVFSRDTKYVDWCKGKGGRRGWRDGQMTDNAELGVAL